jgi:diaminopimelate epimerase
MRLTKHHALGNDFLILLDEAGDGPLLVEGDLARQVCDRRRGVGADGLIHGARSDDPDVDLVMHLFNSDGSRAEMSGNGIRCLGQAFAMHRGVDEGTFEVLTDAGKRTLEVEARLGPATHEITSAMGKVAEGREVPDAVEARLDGRRHTSVDVGNPHLVVVVDDLGAIDLAGDGAWLEAQFPQGVNVEFITPADAADQLALSVWERGAGVTEACGTGACAAAWAAHRWSMVGDDVSVVMPGGIARVLLDGDLASLASPVHFVATVETADG